VSDVDRWAVPEDVAKPNREADRLRIASYGVLNPSGVKMKREESMAGPYMVERKDLMMNSESALHRFDLHLSGRAIMTLRWALDSPRIYDRISHLPEPLAECLIDKSADNLQGAPVPTLLLNDDEFTRIVDAVRFLPLGSQQEWPYGDYFCDDAVLCTGEIRRRLAVAEAERWAATSQCFSRALQAKRLPLYGGLEVLQQWTIELRKYLEALCEYRFLPRPNGHFPTPTHPEQATTGKVEPVDPLEPYIRKMKAAILRRTDGRDASPDALIKLVGVNRKFGRDALRRLQADGEYSGFLRDKPDRYAPPN
jgi:hypothetical protein